MFFPGHRDDQQSRHDVKARSGFTLVELSIVLVILGLLVGGVLAGQSLIRAAELRSVTTQYNQYIAATHSFRDKYFALPGDMTNAQSFWGVAHATPATCVTTASTTSATCNGNGDGWVSVSAPGSNEDFRFWQHLANAGLIEGSYSGITQGSTAWSATTANAPRGRLGNSLWFVHYWGIISGWTDVFNGTYNNFIELGGSIANTDPALAIFKPEELWNIDTKMDDGMPATGKLTARAGGGLSLCTTTVTNNSATLTATYLLNSTGVTCNVLFPNAF